MIREADMMIACGNQSSLGPVTIDQLSNVSIDDILLEVQNHAPLLYALFQQVVHTSRNICDRQSTLPVKEMKALMSLCTLINARSNRFKGMQLLLSMMLIARATNKQVHTAIVPIKAHPAHRVHVHVLVPELLHMQAMRVFNHAGVCLSYDGTWQHLLKLTEKARYPEIV